MRDPLENLSESAKHVVDALSVATVLGTLTDMLPSIAAVFTIVWTGLRIYESRTVQGLLGKKVSDTPEGD